MLNRVLDKQRVSGSVEQGTLLTLDKSTSDLSYFKVSFSRTLKYFYF